MKGSFVFSLDTELAWGWMEEETDRSKHYPLFKQTRAVIARLLDLMDKYEVPATWALVGRLVEKSEQRKRNIQLFYPNLTEDSLYSNEQINSKEHSFLYYIDLVESIKRTKIQHDIGSHSYSHITFGPLKRNRHAAQEVAHEDFKAMQEVMQDYGLKISSFVFPQNALGYQDMLKHYGIRIFRGQDYKWYSSFPKYMAKICRQIDFFSTITPICSHPTIRKDGLLETKGSLHFAKLPYGFKKYVPFRFLEQKAMKGIKEAADNGTVFHLWTHPFDLAHESEKHLKILENIFIEINKQQSKGLIEVCTMNDLVEKYQF